MKQVRMIRCCLQFMAFVAVLCVIGSVGAWEMGSINFVQLLLQLMLFAFCGLFAARLSHERFFVRVRRRRLPAAVAPPVHRHRIAAAHAL